MFRVAPGVHRIPLPMPGDFLKAVNVYAVDDGDHLALIDSGVAVPDARDRLRQALDALDCGLADVTRFLVTHIHYDHYSQALALRDEFGTRVSLGRGESPSVDVLLDESIPPVWHRLQLLRQYGDPELADRIAEERARRPRKSSITGVPDTWLDDEQVLDAGGRALRTVHTPGHTRGHVVFVDAATSLLFAGDHVLPHITPSIGFEPSTAALPLGDYLGSLRRVRAMPDARLLPAHGPVTDSVHARVDELMSHHAGRLDHIAELLAAGASTPASVARAMTWTRRARTFDELDPFNQMLAVLEVGAHLDLLVVQERVVSSEDAGVMHYRLP